MRVALSILGLCLVLLSGCSGGDSQQAGTTTSATCGGGMTECTEKCTDLQTDGDNCGACGTACTNGGACMAGQCQTTCPSAMPTMCGTSPNAVCTDLQTDDNNCGTCGTTCGTGQTCTGGICTCSTAGETVCGASCTDLQTDTHNCGTCGIVCAGGDVCVTGTCKAGCVAGTTDNCILTATASGSTDTGACAAGYTGACSYSCANGTFTQVTNTCAADGCVAETTDNCILTATASGSTDTGACTAGYTGACSYSCANGTFTQVTNTCAANPCAAETTTDNCILTATASGSTDTGACAAGYTGACSYSCDLGAFTQVTNTCAADACAAEATNNCILTATASGSTDIGTCAAGYAGACSYSCDLGAFTQVTNTCAADACAAETTNNCILTATASGSTDIGTCAAGYAGACSYSCDLGAFTQVTNTCAADACAAETNNNCVLTATNSGSTDIGTCAAGYAGACSYACSLGTFTQVTNTCAADPCAAKTTNNCVLTATNSGSTDTGTCASGYAGGCSYSCSLGTFTQVTNTCAADPCAAETINHCTLTATNSGSTDTGTCAAGYSGTCFYSCSLGTFTQVTNTCTPVPSSAHNITDGTNAYMSQSGVGTVYTVNEATGANTLLTSSAPGGGFTMAFFNGVLYAGTQAAIPTKIYTVNTATGAFTTFATLPDSTGNFLCGMWFDPSGNLYFNDGSTTTVWKVTMGGAVSAFITSADGHLAGNTTQGTTDALGNHYIASRSASEILKYNAAGTWVGTLTASCPPWGIAMASSGNLLYTCDTTIIYELNLSSGVNSTWATPGGTLAYMSVDTTGNVYVGEWNGPSAFKYSSAGALLWTTTIGVSSAF